MPQQKFFPSPPPERCLVLQLRSRLEESGVYISLKPDYLEGALLWEKP